jgi:hypothetical protein
VADIARAATVDGTLVSVCTVIVTDAAVRDLIGGAVTGVDVTDLSRTRVVVGRAVGVLLAAASELVMDALLGAHITAVSGTVVVVVTEIVRAGAVVRIRRVDAGGRLCTEVTDINRARLGVITVVIVITALLSTV